MEMVLVVVGVRDFFSFWKGFMVLVYCGFFVGKLQLVDMVNGFCGLVYIGSGEGFVWNLQVMLSI